MDQKTVLEQLKGIVTTILGEPPEAFGLETTLEGLGLDSVERVELLVQLEDAFGVSIPNADAIHLSSIDSLVRYLRAQERTP
jgi:acyl carrier protein